MDTVVEKSNFRAPLGINYLTLPTKKDPQKDLFILSLPLVQEGLHGDHGAGNGKSLTVKVGQSVACGAVYKPAIHHGAGERTVTQRCAKADGDLCVGF
jgi:hypothetical protein